MQERVQGPDEPEEHRPADPGDPGAHEQRRPLVHQDLHQMRGRVVGLRRRSGEEEGCEQQPDSERAESRSGIDPPHRLTPAIPGSTAQGEAPLADSTSVGYITYAVCRVTQRNVQDVCDIQDVCFVSWTNLGV